MNTQKKVTILNVIFHNLYNAFFRTSSYFHLSRIHKRGLANWLIYIKPGTHKMDRENQFLHVVL